MLVRSEDPGSSDFVSERRMIKIATSLKYFLVKYVGDDVKLCQKTKGALCVLGRRRIFVLLSRMRLPGYWPCHFTLTECDSRFCVSFQFCHEDSRRNADRITSLNWILQVHVRLWVNGVWKMAKLRPTVALTWYTVSITMLSINYFDESPGWPCMVNNWQLHRCSCARREGKAGIDYPLWWWGMAKYCKLHQWNCAWPKSETSNIDESPWKRYLTTYRTLNRSNQPWCVGKTTKEGKTESNASGKISINAGSRLAR